MAQRICVTGAAGQAGRAVVRDLLEHGYEVAATDIAVSEADRFEGMLRADLTDYGARLRAGPFLARPCSRLRDFPHDG